MNAEDRELLIDHEKLAEEKKHYERKLADEEKMKQDWREGVLGTPAGRRSISDILAILGWNSRLFNADPLIMAANCAKHDCALTIIENMEKADPGATIRIVNEIRSLQASKDK